MHLLLAVAPPDIGMHHVALDGAGPDDRHLDHQIVEAARTHARQEVHLRAALHLEDADAVGPAEHVVDLRILGRQRREAVPLAVMLAQKIEGLADAGQHAKAQHIDLQDAQSVDIVLVPADHRALFHRGILDGHQLIKPPFGDDEPAHMLAQVPREADDLENELHGQAQPRVVRIKPDLAHAVRLQPVGGEEPQSCEESAPIVSSDRPIALPTSRTARLPR